MSDRQAVSRTVPVIDLTAEDDGDSEEGRGTPAPKHSPKGPANFQETAPAELPLPSPQSLQPTLVLDVDGSDDMDEELSSTRACELTSTGPQGTPRSMSKRAAGGPPSSGPSGSKKRPCLSPGQRPQQQPDQQERAQDGQVSQPEQQLHSQEGQAKQQRQQVQPEVGQVNQPEQPKGAPEGQVEQPKQRHQRPMDLPVGLQAQALAEGLPSQLERPCQGPEIDQGNQVTELLSDTPFKLMKMRLLLPPHQNKYCCGGDPAELVAPGRIKLMLSSNMCPDISWLLCHAPHMALAEHLVILHGVSNEAALEPLRERLLLGDPPLMPPRTHLTMHRCPLPYEYGTQHAKYIVLQYNTGLRFILHTANPLKGTDDISVQAMWHQDFPPKDNVSPPSSDFEETFCDYVEHMRLPSSEQDLILNAIRLHDFSSARAFLVPSVPGQHSGVALQKYGHMRLRHLLQQHLDAAPLSSAGVANPGRRGTLSSLFRNSESGTSHSGQGQRDVPEGIVVQPTSIGSLNSNWFYNDFGASLCAAKSSPLKVPLRKAKPMQPKPLTPEAAYFVWPSYEGIRSSVGGWRSGGNVHATAANMEKDGKFLFPLLHHFSGEAASRAECMPHMKSYCRFKGQQLAYAIVGSHNLSVAAWGGPPRKGLQDVLMIRSYELSVLMMPMLETAYRRHRHYEFSCTPAGDSLVSRVPQQGDSPVSRPLQQGDPPVSRVPQHGDSPVSRVPQQGDPPVSRPLQQGDSPVSRVPQQGDSPVSRVPQKGYPPVSRDPQQGDPPVSRVPQQGDSPVSRVPQQGDPPVCRVPQQGDSPVSRVPQQGDSPVSRVPQQGDSPVSRVPQHGDSPVSRVPQQEDSPVSRVPQQGDPPVSRVPQQGDSPVSRVPQQGDSPVSRVPQQGDPPVSRVPQQHHKGVQAQLQTAPEQQGKPQEQQQQRQQQLGPRQPTQKSVQFWSLDSFINMRREAVFGSVPRPPSLDSRFSPSSASPSASRHTSQLQCPDPHDLDACAFLPLPYFLPPKPYKRSDIPWTYSAPDGVDRFGEHLREPGLEDDS